MIGATISHYKILQKIGEGGMGVVYKARDTHLDRFVAVKVLPPEKVADPDRKRRFVQEAKAASALNHPNIVHVYDIGQSEGTDYIAMEYVEGKTLDQRIGRRGLRLDDALKYAVQIADALAKAHSAGIVHRDLKPTNIIVNEDGLVKVLDFGLAKLTEQAQGDEATATATIDDEGRPVTGEGVIVGTVAYMSPEQLRGEEVDTQSDIFSFGLVLYEMITGVHPFRKESPMETGSAILHQEPKPVGAITQGIPPELDKLIRRCLRKDLERRFQHIGDIRIALLELKEDLAAGPSDVTPATPRQVTPMRVLTGLVTLIVLVSLALVGWYWLSPQRSAEPEAPLVAEPLTSYPGYEDSPSFSPDGNFVAFQWCGEAPGANCDIWIKQIGVEPPSQLTTDPAVEFSPAWSPDGLFIAFLRQLSPSKSAVIIVPRTGGQERVLGESDVSREVITGGVETPFLAWTPDSKWLVIPTEESGPRGGVLSLLSVETREKRPLTISAAGSKYDAAPAFSPDGRSMTFVRWYGNRSDLYLLRLGMDYKPQREQPLSVSTEEPWTFSADWTPDESEILFSRSPGNLWRIPASGSGKPQKLAVATEHLSLVAVSRKGNRLAYSVPNSKSSIWHVDLKGPNQSPTAPLPLIRSTRNQYFPMYSRDGKRIAYDSDISGHPEIWTCNSDGSNAVPLTSFGRNPRWAPDGRSIVFAARVADNMGIYIIGANGGSPRRLPVNGLQSWPWPFWSRDSQWIYFRSESSGSSEIWKTPVTGGDAVQITPNGHGRDQPLESPDGKFLYYLHADGFPEQCSVWRMPTEGGEETKVVDSTACLAYDVRDQGIFFFSRPDKQGRNDISFYDFFTGETRKILTGEHQRWSITVSPDGRTLVYVQEDQSGTDLMLVDNFR